MSVNGKFSNVEAGDFTRFAERHEIPYARKSIKDVKSAVALWPDFAAGAGLSKAASDGIRTSLVVI
jgi:hypothetical protein